MVYDKWEKSGIGTDIRTDKIFETDNNVYIEWIGSHTAINLSTSTPNVDLGPLFTIPVMANKTVDGGLSAQQSKEFVPSTWNKFANMSAPTSNLAIFLSATINAHDKVLAENKSITTLPNVYNGAGIDRNVAEGGNGFAFNENYYKFDNPNRAATDPVVNKMTVALDGDITTYLKVSSSTTSINNVILQKIGGVADPKVNISGKVLVSGYDVYGKKHTFTIPVVILFPHEEHPRR